MRHNDQDILGVLLARLEAAKATEIKLEECGRKGVRMYRARTAARWVYVDRLLAIRLRESGAIWAGDLLRDPCAVA